MKKIQLTHLYILTFVIIVLIIGSCKSPNKWEITGKVKRIYHIDEHTAYQMFRDAVDEVTTKNTLNECVFIITDNEECYKVDLQSYSKDEWSDLHVDKRVTFDTRVYCCQRQEVLCTK